MNSPLKLGAEIVLKIDKMAVGGMSLGRFENAVVFVPFGAPGDEVKVTITEAKKNFYQGEIKEVLSSSKYREKPRCIHFGECGGCQWQHISSPEQLNQKKIILQDLINKFLPGKNIVVPDVTPSAQFYNYRNRSQPKKSNGIVGFNRRRTHDVVDIQECHLLEEPLAADWLRLKNEIKSDAKPEGRSEIYLDLVGAKHWRWIEDQIEDALFSQVNRFQNADLIACVVNRLKVAPPKNFLELYAGAGNFTFPVFQEFFKKSQNDIAWIAVEKMSALVAMAHNQMKQAKITPSQLQFIAADVETFLRRWDPRKYDFIFVDPPRAGLPESVLKSFAVAKIKRIMYVSCNAVSLVRDLQILFKLNENYRVDFIQPFEMFPQTDHFEVIVEISLG